MALQTADAVRTARSAFTPHLRLMNLGSASVSRAALEDKIRVALAKGSVLGGEGHPLHLQYQDIADPRAPFTDFPPYLDLPAVSVRTRARKFPFKRATASSNYLSEQALYFAEKLLGGRIINECFGRIIHISNMKNNYLQKMFPFKSIVLAYRMKKKTDKAYF